MDREVIVIGAGGHSRVIVDILQLNGKKVAGILDDDHKNKEALGGTELIEKYKDTHDFIIAIGSNRIRKIIAERHPANYVSAIHPRAVVAEDVIVGPGTVIMAGAIINPATKIGKHCIINTGAIVDHDNDLADYVHISPGVVLSGTIEIGERTWIGAGAKVINNIKIGRKSIVGAGSLIIRDIDDNKKIVGIPGREIE